MHLARIVILLAVTVVASGQGPADFPTFTSQASAAMATARDSVASMPQPRMTWSGQDWALTCAAQTVCNNITIMNNYVDGLKRMGIMIVDANWVFRVMACAPEYAPGGGDVTLACTPTYQAIYNNYVLAVSHIQANGQTFRMGWFPSSQEQTDCPLTGTTTEAQLEACERPLIVAAAKHWPGVDLQIMEEPTTLGLVLGGGGAQFSVADIHTFLVNVSAAVRAASPTTKVGASICGIAGTQNGGTDYAYWTDWYATTPGAILDFLVVDVYQSTCVITSYAADLANYAALIAGAHAAHSWDIRVGQSGPPRWCQGNHSNESQAIIGTGNIQMAPTWTRWIDMASAWGRGQKLTSWAIFCSAPLFWFTSDSTQDHSTTGTYLSTTLLGHLGENSTAGIEVGTVSTRGAFMQGYAEMGGYTRVE